MIKLQIRRKTAKVWQHFITNGSDFIISKCYCKTNGDKFRVVEDGGTQKNEYNFDEIEVYDDLNSGIAETFTSSLKLMERLSALGYVGFNKDGDVVIADLISTDPSNAIEEGTDNKLFVPVSIGGGIESVNGSMVDNTDPLNPIIESDSDKQDTLNAINLGQIISDDLAIKSTPSPDDKIVIWNSITAEAATAEFSSFSKFDIFDLQKYSIYAWRPLPDGWYGFTIPAAVGNIDFIGPSFTGNDFIKAVRQIRRSFSTSGRSVEFYEPSSRQTSVGDGFYFSMKFGNEDVAYVENARLFAGLTAGLAAIGNVNPSTLARIIGVGADSGDTNLQFMHNNSAGTAVKVNLGSDFPANTNATDLYCLQMYNIPASTSIWYKVINISTKRETAWTEVTTELPETNVALVPHCWRNNGTNALSVRLALVDLTIYKRI